MSKLSSEEALSCLREGLQNSEHGRRDLIHGNGVERSYPFVTDLFVDPASVSAEAVGLVSGLPQYPGMPTRPLFF